VRRYGTGRVTIYTDGAGWYADACRWADVEHVVYDRPLRNPMERINRYIGDGGVRRPLPHEEAQAPVRADPELALRVQVPPQPLLTNTRLGRAPVEWNPPPWPEESEFGRVLGWIVSLG
jgi:hypothetical protein